MYIPFQCPCDLKTYKAKEPVRKSVDKVVLYQVSFHNYIKQGCFFVVVVVVVVVVVLNLSLLCLDHFGVHCLLACGEQ